MRAFYPLFLASAVLFAGCTAAGGNGGGGGGGSAIAVGLACTPGYTDVCSYVNGLPAVLHCDSKASVWAAAQVCMLPISCGMDSGSLTCLEPASQDAATTGDTGADASTSPDTTVAQSDTGSISQDIQPDTQDTYTPPKGPVYSWVVLDGSPNPDCSTNSPGPDIDAVALYRKIGSDWFLMGMGKAGTQVVKQPANPKCTGQNNYDNAYAACGPVNGTVSATAKDTGYFGLGDRSLYLQIGACSDGTQDLKKCDGNGAVQEIKLGDQLAIWEVDQSYKTPCLNDGNDAPQCGYAYDKCSCATEQYRVGLATSMQGASFMDLGVQTGTNMFIDVVK